MRLEAGPTPAAPLLAAVILVLAGCPQSQPDASGVAANNRGVGLMGQYKFDEARQIFEGLAAAHPDWLDVRVNLAVAALNRQQEGDEQRALDILAAVLEADPDHWRAHYCSGILKFYRGRLDEALGHFRLVAEADPADAYAAYYVGQCVEPQDREEALRWYERAAARDPYLRSAYYRRFQLLLRLRRSDEAQQARREWESLKDNPRARDVAIVYTRMGPKADALAFDLSEPAPIAPLPQGPLFVEPRPLPIDGEDALAWRTLEPGEVPSVTVCDIDGDSHLDLFVAGVLTGSSGARNAVLLGTGAGRFKAALEHPLADVDDVNAALWGDYDNDGLTDVYLCRRGPNQLWHQRKQGEWADVTGSTGTANGSFDTVDGAIFDADHDGDLDIFCVNADGPNDLLNNNLDGTFRSIGQAQGIAGDGRPSRQVLVTDLDRDRDADIVVINDEPPHEVYVNDRLWQYRQAEGFDALRAARITVAVAADLDADGRTEIYTAETGRPSDQWGGRWSMGEDGNWASEPLSWPPDSDGGSVRALAVADVTGDGSLNLLVGQSDGVSVLDRGAVIHRLRPPRGSIAAWLPVVIDPPRGPEVVAVTRDGALIWSPGSGRHRFAALSFSGREDKGKSMRSNASGIGTHVEVRVDSRWTILDTFRPHSGPGQSLQPLAVGLGGAGQIDFIAIDWSDGVFQSEIDLAAGELHAIEETQRQSSSCPVLFAWNGHDYEFVSDLLGVGGLGYLVAPGTYAPPRPWENFLLPADLLRPKNGRYVLKLTEPMEEACYLDAAALTVYELPPGWQMTLDERMGISDPQPTGEPRFYRRAVHPMRAVSGRGEEVTAALAEADGRAASVGELDHRFIGRLRAENAITLIFDEPLEDQSGQPMLVADGWIEYPYSQTMFAAWQAGAEYRAPTLEARGADGRWQVVLEQFGYPAGMPRQMSVVLPDLPAGTTELRLSTNQEIYWDRLFVAFAEPCPDARRRTLTPAAAAVRYCGFPLRTTGPQRRPVYDYAKRAPYWDTRHQAGMYTTFGPADALVARADDALAIFGPGEEILIEFLAEEATPPSGWTRRFVLETVGWCKDMDLFTRSGETVGPLPVRGEQTAERQRLHDRYNTRYRAGR